MQNDLAEPHFGTLDELIPAGFRVMYAIGRLVARKGGRVGFNFAQTFLVQFLCSRTPFFQDRMILVLGEQETKALMM